MEGEARKRSTDCVYFLASPLTCKKGSECEYRHSESARLNPIDCWYWLNRTCLNPNCAFRHPPLEGILETVPEPTQLPSYVTIPTSKPNVPCYFYFNTYCIKGDQCPFLHDVLPAQKFSKSAPDTTNVQHHPENKPSTGSDTGPASIEVPANSPGDTEELIKQRSSKEVIQLPAQGVALEERSPSAKSSVPDMEEPGIKLSEENLYPPTEFINGSPQLCPDQGLAENAKDCEEADEWWESSPGFDVLVDDGSEQLAYEEDGDYILAQERESEMIHSHLLQYDYEPSGYDPLAYPDTGFLYEHAVYDSYDPEDNSCIPEYFHKASEKSNERRNLLPTSHRRRKPTRRRHQIVDGRDVVDLRDHLRKRRRTDVSPRKCYSPWTREDSLDRCRERHERRRMRPLFHGRLVTERGNNMHDPALSESEFALSDFHGRRWSGYPQSSRHARSRLREREDRRRNRNPPLVFSSENSHRSSSRRAEFFQTKPDDATFSGPKTLAQIKEDKRRDREAEGNSSANYISQRFRRPGPKDFEAPKPLNELLKDKRRSSSTNGNSSGMASGDEHHASDHKELHHIRTLEKQNIGYESDFVDEEEDEDALHEKFVHMLSS